MLKMRTSLAMALLSLLLNSAGAAGCGTKQSEATQNVKPGKTEAAPAKPTPMQVKEGSSLGEVKVLGAGGYSRMSDAFVIVARDAETYAALQREMGVNLPAMNADFFKTNAVIAAFLGMRRTGGYSVEITRTAGGLRISEKTPPADAMTTQALSSPFKVVSVLAAVESSIPVELDNAWQAAMRPYRVASGEFITGGGLIGRAEKFPFEGDIRVMRQGNLATFAFDLKSAGGAKTRGLKDTVTGVVQQDGRVSIAHLDAGSFVESPRDPLRVTGEFMDSENKLTLALKSWPSNLADGFSGQGKLEAVAAAPPPQKSKSLAGEEP